jgi:hypothetical protein
LGVDLLEERQEPGALRTQMDRPVEAVRLGRGDGLVGLGRGTAGGELLLQDDDPELLDLGIGHPLGREGRRSRLEGGANSVDVLDLIGWDRRDIDPVMWSDFEQAVLLESTDGLTDGIPTDPESLGDGPLVDPGAREVFAIEEGGPKRLVGSLLERVLFRERCEAHSRHFV